MASLNSILSKAASVPTLNTLVRVPTLPGLPGVPLVCGANTALANVEAVRTEILSLLANKKAAITLLASKAGVAQSTIAKLQAAEQTAYSLQNDVVGLLANPSPTQIASFLNRWGTKLPSDQLQSMIGKIDDLVSGKATLNFCADIPNFKIDAVTGALSKDALKALTPNAAPAAAAAVTPTVVDNSQKVSTGSSGVAVGTVEQQADAQLWIPFRKQVLFPSQDAIRAVWTSLYDMNQTSDFKSIVKKKAQYGKTGQELADAGLLSPGEVSTLVQYNSLRPKYDMMVKYRAEVMTYFKDYMVITGGGSNDNGKALADFQKYIAENKDLDTIGFRQYYTIADSIVTGNTALIKQYIAYLENKKSSA